MRDRPLENLIPPLLDELPFMSVQDNIIGELAGLPFVVLRRLLVFRVAGPGDSTSFQRVDCVSFPSVSVGTARLLQIRSLLHKRSLQVLCSRTVNYCDP